MRSSEEIMADMPEDMRVKLADITEMFSKLLANPEAFMPKAECKVCGENRSQDLVAHGPGVARFMYYPCRHSEVHKDHVSTWYDENDEEVEV